MEYMLGLTGVDCHGVFSSLNQATAVHNNIWHGPINWQLARGQHFMLLYIRPIMQAVCSLFMMCEWYLHHKCGFSWEFTETFVRSKTILDIVYHNRHSWLVPCICKIIQRINIKSLPGDCCLLYYTKTFEVCALISYNIIRNMMNCYMI